MTMPDERTRAVLDTRPSSSAWPERNWPVSRPKPS